MVPNKVAKKFESFHAACGGLDEKNCTYNSQFLAPKVKVQLGHKPQTTMEIHGIAVGLVNGQRTFRLDFRKPHQYDSLDLFQNLDLSIRTICSNCGKPREWMNVKQVLGL